MSSKEKKFNFASNVEKFLQELQDFLKDSDSLNSLAEEHDRKNLTDQLGDVIQYSRTAAEAINVFQEAESESTDNCVISNADDGGDKLSDEHSASLPETTKQASNCLSSSKPCKDGFEQPLKHQIKIVIPAYESTQSEKEISKEVKEN